MSNGNKKYKLNASKVEFVVEDEGTDFCTIQLCRDKIVVRVATVDLERDSNFEHTATDELKEKKEEPENPYQGYFI